jgi:hypothetical protein
MFHMGVQRQCAITVHPAARGLSKCRPPWAAHSCYGHISGNMAGGECSYSIWLMPDPAEDFCKRVAAEIEYWAPKKDGPLFAPHVTLIGGITGTKVDVLGKTEALSKQLRVRSIPLLARSRDQRNLCTALWAALALAAAYMRFLNVTEP